MEIGQCRVVDRMECARRLWLNDNSLPAHLGLRSSEPLVLGSPSRYAGQEIIYIGVFIV